MKTNYKFIVPFAIVLFLTAIIASIIVCVTTNKNLSGNLEASITANSSLYTEKKDVEVEADNQDEILQSLEAFENEFNNRNTSAIELLNAQIADYRALLEASENETKKELIVTLINTTQHLIDSYVEYENSKYFRSQYHAIYTPIVAAAIAYFKAENLKLSAELLTHAYQNNVYKSYYIPINVDFLAETKILNKVANGNNETGQESFESTENLYERDAFYAIHGFTYTKLSKKSMTVTILDTYDFDDKMSYDGLLNIAKGTIYKAQQANAITIYDWECTLTLDKNGKVNPSFGDLIELQPGERIGYNLTFTESGNHKILVLNTDQIFMLLYVDGRMTNVEKKELVFFADKSKQYYLLFGNDNSTAYTLMFVILTVNS